MASNSSVRPRRGGGSLASLTTAESLTLRSYTSGPDARVFLVYYKPTQAAALDESPRWRRYFADQIAFSEEDARYAPFSNRSDSAVIWQLDTAKREPPRPGAERSIEIIIPDIAAIVPAR